MVAQSGADLLIRVGDNADPEIFTTIGGLRLTGLILNQLLIESSHVGSGPWRALLGGHIRSLTINGAGVFTDSAAEALVRAYAFASELHHYELAFGNGDILFGAFLIRQYARSGSHNGEEQYSIVLESGGPIAFTPAA